MATNRAGDEVDLTTWIGRVEKARDVVRPFPVAALQATLDYPGEPVSPGTPLPPLWHWLYFLPAAPAVRARAGRPRRARRIPSPGNAAAPHVGRGPVRLLQPAARR